MPQTIRVGDLTVLHAPAARTATQRPVLFIHGYFADASVFSEWLQFFAARGFPAYAVNLRGRSDSRTNVYLGRVSIDDFVEDAATVARKVHASAIVGHSMGGLIAQRLAEQGVADAVALVTPAPPRGITALTRRVAIKQLKYLPSILLSRIVKPSRDDLREIVLNCVPASLQDAMLDAMVPDSGRAARDMSVFGVPVDASRVRCPMLVIAAAEDRFIPLKSVQRIAERYGAKLRTIPGHGHTIITEPGWEELADSIAAGWTNGPGPLVQASRLP